MDMVLKLFVFSHVMAGVVSLVTAPIAMAVSKGGKAHRISGKIFFWSMVWIFISALVLGITHWKPFLLMVSVLSFYLVYSGYRTLDQKQLSQGKGVEWYDWAIAIGCALCMLSFLAWSVYLMFLGNAVFLFTFFSIGGLFSIYAEVKAYVKKPERKHRWLLNHIGRMMGGFIAALTAFSTNVLTFMPGLWQWLWPTIIGTPLIIYWIRMYRKKIDEGVRITDLVQLNKR